MRFSIIFAVLSVAHLGSSSLRRRSLLEILKTGYGRRCVYRRDIDDISTLISDCEALHEAMALPPGRFDVHTCGDSPSCYHPIASRGNCVFGARTTLAGNSTIGSSDIADLLKDSIKTFGEEKHFGAQGTMRCETDRMPLENAVYWIITDNLGPTKGGQPVEKRSRLVKC